VYQVVWVGCWFIVMRSVSYKLPVQESPDLADSDSQRLAAVSATVYLDSYTLECIKQVCREENRRISDVICDAVERYLRERTKMAFEGELHAR
jgi:hypothetical protein